MYTVEFFVFCHHPQDHLSRPGAPFYVGAMIESLHAESTLETEQSKPGLLQGSCSPSSGGAMSARRRNETTPDRGLSGRNIELEGEQVARGGGHNSLVKKELNLNQLAVYWNPAEDGNPCSMHLSDIPVEQAEVVLSRRADALRQVLLGGWGGTFSMMSDEVKGGDLLCWPPSRGRFSPVGVGPLCVKGCKNEYIRFRRWHSRRMGDDASGLSCMLDSIAG